jgi:hypothetical protein
LSDLEVGVSRAPTMKNKAMKTASSMADRAHAPAIAVLNRSDRNKLLPPEVDSDARD